jgi:hypothetical protein
MPSVDQHIAQWKHNRRCAQSIDSQFRDWQINVVFYAALHAVDAAPWPSEFVSLVFRPGGAGKAAPGRVARSLNRSPTRSG